MIIIKPFVAMIIPTNPETNEIECIHNHGYNDELCVYNIHQKYDRESTSIVIMPTSLTCMPVVEFGLRVCNLICSQLMLVNDFCNTTLHQIGKTMRIHSPNMNVTQCYIELVSSPGIHISSS